MFLANNRPRLFLVVLLGTLTGVVAWWLQPSAGDPRLAAFVQGRPAVPVVFTSRTEPASFQAAAAHGLGLTYPGQPQWQASAGRLRLLTPRGTVHELTWGQVLPDGDTLIDVMSPSISSDGRTILFAGRRRGDHGRFRLYEIGVDGRGLQQLTGGPDDPGCTALPPMRYRQKEDQNWPVQALLSASCPLPGWPLLYMLAARGGPALVPEPERRCVDYDDVDPVYLSNKGIAFVSSRLPDLGRGHARRGTNLWVMDADGRNKFPLTGNRNNDRWPVMLSSGFLAYSEWSRNTEVIVADLTDIQPYRQGMAAATRPTDAWQGLRIAPNGDQFGLLVKLPFPVWRPRPLFNGRVVFMTNFAYGTPGWDPASHEMLEVVQAPINLVANVASARPADQDLPRQKAGLWQRGPVQDAQGQPLSLATPNPCPPDHILLSAAVCQQGQARPTPEQYGLYLAKDRWQPEPGQPASAEAIHLQLLFDDPDLVDAEPVAVYPRDLHGDWADITAHLPGSTPVEIDLVQGTTYRGLAGQVVNGDLYLPTKREFPGQPTDAGQQPIFQEPPAALIDHIRFFASYRDRFDHTFWPRLEGQWQYLVKVPVAASGSFTARLPAGVPTVLAGFTTEGKVGRWTTPAQDSQGRQGTFFTYAGDHYNSFRPGEHSFCMGCHPGHTGLETLDQPERRR